MAARTGPRRSRKRNGGVPSGAVRIAGVTVPIVLAESTRVAIEKMAADVAQEMLADPTFRAELREIVKRVSEESVR
jgi:hypothetical protein